MTKNDNRLRRARRSRAKIRELGIARLTIHRTPRHMYAQIIGPDGGTVVVSASTLQKDVREALDGTGNIAAAAVVGEAEPLELDAGQAAVRRDVVDDLQHELLHLRLRRGRAASAGPHRPGRAPRACIASPG